MEVLAKKIGLLMLILLFFTTFLHAAENLPNEIKKALELPPGDAGARLYKLSVSYILDGPIDSIEDNHKKLITAIAAINLVNKNAISYEIEAIYAKRLMKLQQAKSYILKALNEPTVPQYELIRILTVLAYINTDLENYSGAMENYNMIEKLLTSPKDIRRLAANYIDESDLYTKAALYKEAIASLKKALKLVVIQKGASVPVLLYLNIAETYFYLGNRDSLQYYTNKILRKEKKTFTDTIALHHLKYMALFLNKDPKAIDEIKIVINNPKDGNNLSFLVLLAQAYYQFNQTENAKKAIFKTLATGDIKDLKYLSSKLYNLLGDIYQKENNTKLSSFYYKKSIEQSSQHIENQLNSENILVSLKYYALKDKYNVAEKDITVKKGYLKLLAIVAVMIILILFLSYKSLQIKKKFNELRFKNISNEISMMNSHEVRRYLANILGIITVLQVCDDKYETYLEVENALWDSAENLDKSIKSINDKLNNKSMATG